MCKIQCLLFFFHYFIHFPTCTSNVLWNKLSSQYFISVLKDKRLWYTPLLLQITDFTLNFLSGKDIIVSGGEPVLGKNTWNLGVYCFDTFNEQWRQLTDLQSPRRHHASCAIDKCLYLLGGFGRYRVRLNSMEKYDCDEGKNMVELNNFMPATGSVISVILLC